MSITIRAEDTHIRAESRALWADAQIERDFRKLERKHYVWLIFEYVLNMMDRNRSRPGHEKPADWPAWLVEVEQELFPAAWNLVFNRVQHDIDSSQSETLPLPTNLHIRDNIRLVPENFVEDVLDRCMPYYSVRDFDSTLGAIAAEDRRNASRAAYNAFNSMPAPACLPAPTTSGMGGTSL